MMAQRMCDYSKVCRFEFVISRGDKDTPRIRNELLGFLQRVIFGSTSDMGLLGGDIIQSIHQEEPIEVVELVKGSFFVSLTCKNVHDILDKMPLLAAGCSAMEFRVDLLASWDLDFVRDQCALLRRCSPLPVIYTVRTKSQGGAFPDDEEQYFALSQMAVRCGFQWVDLESHWSPERTQEFLRCSGWALPWWLA